MGSSQMGTAPQDCIPLSQGLLQVPLPILAAHLDPFLDEWFVVGFVMTILLFRGKHGTDQQGGEADGQPRSKLILALDERHAHHARGQSVP